MAPLWFHMRPNVGRFPQISGINAPVKRKTDGPKEFGHKILQTFIGKVVSTKNKKTINVEVTQFHFNKLINKYIKGSNRFMSHDEMEECNYGDIVEIRPCRPLSKRKHHILHRILKQRPVIRPEEDAPQPITWRNLLLAKSKEEQARQANTKLLETNQNDQSSFTSTQTQDQSNDQQADQLTSKNASYIDAAPTSVSSTSNPDVISPSTADKKFGFYPTIEHLPEFPISTTDHAKLTAPTIANLNTRNDPYRNIHGLNEHDQKATLPKAQVLAEIEAAQSMADNKTKIDPFIDNKNKSPEQIEAERIVRRKARKARKLEEFSQLTKVEKKKIRKQKKEAFLSTPAGQQRIYEGRFRKAAVRARFDPNNVTDEQRAYVDEIIKVEDKIKAHIKQLKLEHTSEWKANNDPKSLAYMLKHQPQQFDISQSNMNNHYDIHANQPKLDDNPNSPPTTENSAPN